MLLALLLCACSSSPPARPSPASVELSPLADHIGGPELCIFGIGG